MDTQREWDNMISFWFDRSPMDWFMPPEGLDDEIRTRYQDLIAQARAGELDHWTKDPKGVVCLVLLLDQFPRNIFRGSSDSFSSDVQAQKIVTRAIAQQFDKQIGQTSKFQQIMFYMPFMHAEDLVTQIAGVALFDSLKHTCEEGSDEQQYLAQTTQFSQRHLDCVAQLGRFPKRNKALGRLNTAEEEEYLKDKPEGF